MADGDHSAAGPGREWLIPSTLVLSPHTSDGIEGIYTIVRGKAVSKSIKGFSHTAFFSRNILSQI